MSEAGSGAICHSRPILKVLSFTHWRTHEAARVHHASWWHGGDVAVGSAGANAAEDGADRLSWRGQPNCKPESPRGVPARTSGPWLRRRAKLRVGGSLRPGAVGTDTPTSGRGCS